MSGTLGFAAIAVGTTLLFAVLVKLAFSNRFDAYLGQQRTGRSPLRCCCSSSATGSPSTTDPSRPRCAPSVGCDGYDLDQLATDLDPFVFLLDGSDGEPLFQPRPR